MYIKCKCIGKGTDIEREREREKMIGRKGYVKIESIRTGLPHARALAQALA